MVRLNPAARARLVDAYSPGARVLRARRLRGGIGARAQLLHLEHADGRREAVVLRAYLPARPTHTPQRADREFRTIALVRELGIAAPQPLFLDATGEFLGEPSMLLAYMPGRPLFAPDRIEPWAEQLASAMACIHAVEPVHVDLSWLPRMGKRETAAELTAVKEVPGADGSLIREALGVLRGALDHIEWTPVCLVHEDFWPGNTVWYRGKLTAIIDWSNARVGDWRQDVSQCCVDALWINGPAAAEAIRDAYCRASGRASEDQWFFDLFVGLSMLLAVDRTLMGYHDAGLTFVTRDLAIERTRTFMREAMQAGATRAS